MSHDFSFSSLIFPPPLSPGFLHYSVLPMLPDSCCHSQAHGKTLSFVSVLLHTGFYTQDSIHRFNTCCLCKLPFLLSDFNQLVEESSGSSRQPACPEATRRRWRLQPLVGALCLWNCTCRKQRLPSSSSDTLPRLPSCQKPPQL